MVNFYRKARNYELFMCKAFNCEKGKRYGADESFMINLFLNQLNTTYAKQQRIPPDRQFYKVKMYMERALIKLKRRKKYMNSSEHFMPFLFKLDNAKCPEDLVEIINKSLAKIIELENGLRRSG